LWDHDTDNAYVELHTILRGELSPEPSHLLHLFDHHGLPHFLSTHYVGPQTALEVAEALYKTDSADSMLILSPKQLDHALLRDSFMVGLRPINVLQSLALECKIDHYRTGPASHAQSDTCQHTAAEVRYIDGVELRAQINTLLQVKNKKDFHLKLVLIQRNIRFAVLAEAIQAFRDVRDAFMTEGCDVDIVWAYAVDGYEGVHSNFGPVYWCIDKYFDMPRLEWEDSMRKKLEAVSISIDTKHLH
jgi:hypothetical protein